MTNWNKLKVTELKEELKNRGLPQNGLKAALVARLEEADAGAGAEVESEATIGEESGTQEGSVRASEGAEAEVAPVDESLGEQSGAAQGVESQVADGAVDAISAAAEAQETVADGQNTPVTAAEPAPESEVIPEPAAESATIPPVVSQETAEDTQKRKRRSQSPPPSRADTPRKRARQDKDLPLTDVEEKDEIITTKDDAEWVEKHNGVDAEMVNAESKEVAASGGVEAGPTIVDVAKEEIKVAPVPEAQEDREVVRPEDGDTMMTDGDQSTGKDPRYKDLFSAPAKSADQMDTDTSFERDVAPAIHPATTAIYIRNLMRPLNLADLKSHILEMATVPGKTPHENTIVDFFVDHLRTHAFVSFDTVAAASRVRSEMHERTWPDELSRKPLWVDFIPSEKVEDWMGTELEPTNGGGRGTRKWEVTYQVDDNRTVTATLQEADTVPAMDRRPSAQVPSTFPIPHPGVLGAPLGPRAERAERTERSTSSWGGPPPLPRHKIDDTPTALDSIRTATITQPIIYFQTVTESVANRRLDNMDKVLSKHAPTTPTTGINRYTFEDTDVLVDRGPEIFSGIRPPPGQRRGGFRGRGGGFNDRGSSFRSDRFASDDRRAPPGDRGGSWRGGYADRDRDRDRNWRGAPRSNMPPSDRPWVRDRDQDQGFERERDRRGGFGYDRDERRRGDYGNPRFEGRGGGGYDRYEGRGRDEGRERRW